MKSIITVENVSQENKLPTFRQNEFGFDISFTAYFNDGSIVDLTGKDVKFQVTNINTNTKKIDGTCALDVDPTTGKCIYTIVSTDFDTIGLYEAELEISEVGVDNNKIKLGLFAVLNDL